MIKINQINMNHDYFYKIGQEYDSNYIFEFMKYRIKLL